MAIALLAPVGEEHLLSGLDVCKREGQVAFGSRAWQLFRHLDEILGGQNCDCLIYASAAKQPTNTPVASWRAMYIGHVEGRNGAHPEGMKYRPPTTAKYAKDNLGHWAVFWHVTDLKQLSLADQVKISSLRGYGKSRRYLKNFIPEGPLMIEW